jgi:fumarate hydratase subunit beta
MRETGCVYLAFPGGASPMLSSAIRECLSVGWKDLIEHYRLVRLRVEALGPAVVAIDSHGNSIYEAISRSLEENFTRILDRLNQSRSSPAS